MKKSMIFSTFLSVALLSACTNFTLTPIVGINAFKVDLQVVGGVLTNDRDPNDKCTEFAPDLRKGCFEAGKNEVLELEFKLRQPGDGVKWRFTKVKICKGTLMLPDSVTEMPTGSVTEMRTGIAVNDGSESPINDASSKPRAQVFKPVDVETCSLDPDQQDDWLVIAKRRLALMPSNGTIDLTAFSQKLRRFIVVDINGQFGHYVYNIQACKEGSTDPSDCAWMDPGGTNRGRR